MSVMHELLLWWTARFCVKHHSAFTTLEMYHSKSLRTTELFQMESICRRYSFHSVSHCIILFKHTIYSTWHRVSSSSPFLFNQGSSFNCFLGVHQTLCLLFICIHIHKALKSLWENTQKARRENDEKVSTEENTAVTWAGVKVCNPHWCTGRGKS